VELFTNLKNLYQLRYIVPVNGPEIPQAHVFEELPRYDEMFHGLVDIMDNGTDALSHAGHHPGEFPYFTFDFIEPPVG